MKNAVLGLDCTGETYAVGLLVNGEHQSGIEGLSPRCALRDLPAHTSYLLKNAGLNYRSVLAVGVTKGPGSFTGVRLGITLAKTIAFSADCGVAAFDTLELIAAGWAEAFSKGSVAVALDARRKELYCGVYDLATAKPVVPTDVRTPAQFSELMKGSAELKVLAGAGFKAYHNLVPDRFEGPVATSKRLCQPPVATLCRLTYQASMNGRLGTWGEVRPNYHRKADIQVSVKPLA